MTLFTTVFMWLVTNVVDTGDIIVVIFPRWRAMCVSIMSSADHNYVKKTNAINTVNRVKSDTDGGLD